FALKPSAGCGYSDAEDREVRLPVSAVDVISPAFVRTRRQLFQPFRAGRWARLAVVALITGEFGSGSFGGLNAGFPARIRGRGRPGAGFSLAASDWHVPENLWVWLLAGIVILFALCLAWIYAASAA